MPSQLLISVAPWDVRAALVEEGRLAEIYVERPGQQDPTGNLYKGRVLKVLPGMAAAFVDVGLDKPAYLFAQEAAPSYSDLSQFWLQEGQADPRPPPRLTSPPIAELLTAGQEVLVQVCRPPLGTKGARLTTHIALPGRYLVYLPLASHLAVSRRLASEAERQRLKNLLEDLRPGEGGLIARTASEGQTREVLAVERDALMALWKKIRQKKHRVAAPALLYQELPVVRRLVRDLLSPEVVRLVVDDSAAYEDILAYLHPGEVNRPAWVELYTGPEPLFAHLNLEVDWHRLLASRVWLKSGGYLLIDTTEALTAIDVNTGRYTGGRDLEDTLLTTNLEAAREIARQIRLRNLGGLIIVDFIDLEIPSHRELVHQTLQEAVQQDRARTTVYPMSPLGLVEMTRQRLRDSLGQAATETCPCCHGQGAVLSPRLVAHDLLRQLAWEAREFPGCRLTVEAHPEVLAILQTEGAEFLQKIQEDGQALLQFTETPHLPRDHFDLTRELQEGMKKR